MDDMNDDVQEMIQKICPEEYQCAGYIKTFIKERYKKDMTSAEVAYLTMHIERIRKSSIEKGEEDVSLKAVEDGRTIPMDEVNDQTFAQELLGPGIAIVPSNGTVVSPINGTIATVMDTKHAVCIQGEDGLELIVHAGLDTVELNGKYYQTYKEIGDQVKAGDVLLEFDLEEITKAGYDVTTPIVITNLGDYKITKCLTGQQVKAGEEVIQLTKQ